MPEVIDYCEYNISSCFLYNWQSHSSHYVHVTCCFLYNCQSSHICTLLLYRLFSGYVVTVTQSWLLLISARYITCLVQLRVKLEQFRPKSVWWMFGWLFSHCWRFVIRCCVYVCWRASVLSYVNSVLGINYCIGRPVGQLTRPTQLGSMIELVFKSDGCYHYTGGTIWWMLRGKGRYDVLAM